MVITLLAVLGLFLLLAKYIPSQYIIPTLPITFLNRAFGAELKWHYAKGNGVRRLEGLHRSNGNYIRVSPRMVSVRTPTSVREVYGRYRDGSRDFLKGHWYTHVTPIPNIFTSIDPTEYHALRKLIGPCFAPGQTVLHEATITKHICRLISVIDKSISPVSNVIELKRHIHCFLVDTMTDILLGESPDAQLTGNYPAWTKSLPRVLYWATILEGLEGTGAPTAVKLAFKYLVPKNTKKKHLSPRFDLIRRQWTRSFEEAYPDILAHVMERAKSTSVPERHVVESFMVLMLAGIHTTQTAVCAVVYFVLGSPPTYRKLLNELRVAFPSVNDVTDSVAKQLPYLDAVIMESLRIYPPILLGGPKVSPGAEVDGIFIPPGVEVFGSIFSLHHNPDYFEEPLQFCPERWTDQELRANKEAFLPFLTGARSCIAKHLAMTVIRMTVSAFFVHFDAKYVGPEKDWVKESPCYTLWDVPDLHVQIRSSQQ